MVRNFVSVALFILFLIPAWADPFTPCDCNYENWVENCRATIKKKGKWIIITTGNTRTRCSRVDWYAGTDPHISIVTNGRLKEEWIGDINDNPQLVVDICKVCKDTKDDTSKDVPLLGNKYGSTTEDVVKWLTKAIEGNKEGPISTYKNGTHVWDVQTTQTNFRLEGDMRIRHTFTYIHKFSDGEQIIYKHSYVYDLTQLNPSNIKVVPNLGDEDGFVSRPLSWCVFGLKSINTEVTANGNSMQPHDEGILRFNNQELADDVVKAMIAAVTLSKANR